MAERILVTGGTGVLGRAVVRELVAAGRSVRVLSRRPPPGDARYVSGDLTTGAGLDDAVADTDVVVHLATATSGRAREVALARLLIAAMERAGVPHVGYVSIVGVDQVPLGYYQGKLAVERLLERSAPAHTILRATQFHDLVRTLLAAAATLPVPLVPDVPIQPVDVRDVAGRIAELALGDPAGRVPDFGGPQVRGARDLARAYLAATGRRKPVLPLRLPGKVIAAYRAGDHLAPRHPGGSITFERYLAEHPAPRRLSYRTAQP
ncbi:uncharacterized protein YbjT (DUF2867 family) [Prauserella shujinwangii]|uniref:Uncharacterized protein YbjT (DUF2867 family) n=1 Tax=Prauserella shujinwangii TaxID=1453103 RepID=A0A2T0LPA2_9PSEU|nr:NAD(P)H-binding protein [Prauserella shujinwangii]PRX45063.1 uncharacterized protein YbjT (DUF2867 family) [Prauserella shujinwangii]